MAVFKDSYPIIKSYEKLKDLICKRGAILLQEKEPQYYARFRTGLNLNLKPSIIHKECNPLLSGKFDRYVDLMESLYEVGYYWKRLTETNRLLYTNVSTTNPQQIHEASWFTYNLDYYWIIDSILIQRIIKFLKIFKRIYKSPSTKETKFLEEQINIFTDLKRQLAVLLRNPLFHEHSVGIQGWRKDHQWEAALLRNDTSDFIEIYDKALYKDRVNLKKMFIDRIPIHGEALSIMFDKLSSLSLEKIELK